MKWITYRHHTSPGLSLPLFFSLSVLADLAEHRRGNDTVQFTSHLSSSLGEQDLGLQIRSSVFPEQNISETLGDQKA